VISQILHSHDFARDAARLILEHARKAIGQHGLFRLGLTGGRSPHPVNIALLAQAGDLPWNKVQLTFGDERCVPPDHHDSNFREAKESLIDPAGVPPGNVFRMRGEIDPETAAQEYEAKLAAVAARFGEPLYTHDLLLLGLGEDGHVASLFPGSSALDETTRLVLPVIGPKPPPQRITLTLPLINAARHVLFFVPDLAKREIVEAVRNGDQRYPAARVRGQEQTTWLLGW
jgi:6-phosphogluconolactonase